MANEQTTVAAGGANSSGAQTGAAEWENSRGDYLFLSFLMLLNVMNFVDRQLLASFANFIIPDLELTNTQFGLLWARSLIV